MINLLAPPSVCSGCGEPLGAEKICLACLLRAGFRDDASRPEATRFGDFEIENRKDGSLWEIGRGAMGITYRALDTVLNRTVALKVIEAAGVPAMRERFLREARAAARLRHPNIAGVFQFGASSESERCYCAMELVDGETLEALVRRWGPLAAEIVLEIAVQVTRALIAAADRGLVHRDLKPGNIMLTRYENAAELEVKVIDFGLAKAVSAVGEMELTHGNFVGTPAFASPEQFAHGAIDGRTDIYALGVTMWFALTGRLPFAGTTIEEIRERQTQHALPLEQLKGRAVPLALIALLQFCLAIDPAARPASARELIVALEVCRTHIAARRARKLALALLACALVGVFAVALARNKTATSHPAESLIAAKATDNADAYLLYLRGAQMETSRGIEEFRKAISLYQGAVDLDPTFALARARLSINASNLWYSAGETEWKTKARAEAEEALRLQPNLGEARLAMAYVYLFEDDAERAARAVKRATELLPNSAEVLLVAAFIAKKQNKLRERIAALERAETLDPRNSTYRSFQVLTYEWVRNWPAAMHSLDRRGVVRPNEQAEILWLRGNDEFRLTGDINALKSALAKGERVAAGSAWLNVARYEIAMLERDYLAAGKFLDAVPAEPIGEGFLFESPAHPKVFHEALLAVAHGDIVAARPALERAQKELEGQLSQTKDKSVESAFRTDLALIFAFLGRKEAAINEGLRALDPDETQHRRVEANRYSSALAMVYAQTGEAEKAIALIEHLLTVPCEFPPGAIYNMTLTDLKWRWQWDPLRSHPRFQKLLAGPEPVTVY